MPLDRKKLGISRQVARACILEFSESGQVRGPGRIQYTQFFRAQAGSCSEAYTACSKSLDPGRISILKNSGPRSGSWSLAYTVYSNFSGQGRLPIWSVYKKLEKSGPWAEPVYSKIQGLVRFLVRSVYRKLEKPGQNLYTQIFRIQVRILVVGVYSILEFFGAGQAPDLERIQYTRKVWARAESVYSNFQGQGRLPIWGVYKKLEKSGPR